MVVETVKMISICGFEGMCARVAQWWSIALPRRGSRVRIPSRAFNDTKKGDIRWIPPFLYVRALPGSNSSNVSAPLRSSQVNVPRTFCDVSCSQRDRKKSHPMDGSFFYVQAQPGSNGSKSRLRSVHRRRYHVRSKIICFFRKNKQLLIFVL